MHVQMSCKYFVLEVPLIHLLIIQSSEISTKKNSSIFQKTIATFEKSIKMLKNYTYNHIYLLNVCHVESKEIYA